MQDNRDILGELENTFETFEKNDDFFDIQEPNEVINTLEKEKTGNTFVYETTVTPKAIKEVKKSNSLLTWVIFLTKYLITSTLIFTVLLVTTNYSAYTNLAKSYIFKSDVESTTKWILNTVEASTLKEKVAEDISNQEEVSQDEEVETQLSIKKYKKDLENEGIDLDIEITPYTNRVIIPKIGKNIPLLDIKNQNIEGENELNDIFMDELSNWIIRYPGSAKPGQDGTSFIFGHSSNFPWADGDFNDVFATLDNVVYWDEVIIYYGQEKYTYVIREKKVITPGDVSVLERDKNRSEITLMTCWPVGTTLNRLIVTWELIEVE